MKRLLVYLLLGFVFVSFSKNINAQTWSTVGGGINVTYSFGVFALDTLDNNLYAGGYITSAGGVSANCIAKWNGTKWDSLGSGVGGYGIYSFVDALASYKDSLYVAGEFDTAGGIPANGIAEWNGTKWISLGSGMGGTYPNSLIPLALTVYNGNLYAGGYFTTAGGDTVNYIAEWNGTIWSTVGSGMSGNINGKGNAAVEALTTYNGNLYASGDFNAAGGVPAKNIAMWNGIKWDSLGGGINGQVVALTVYNGNLYAAGNFDTAGGIPAKNIAMWNGTKWDSVGSGVKKNIVLDLAVYNSKLYAVGEFSSAGIPSTSNIAMWNGTKWDSVGSVSGNTRYSALVNTLAIYKDSLYVGGYFTTAGGTAVNNIAEWCGTCPTGINEISDNNASVKIYPNPNNGIFNIKLNVENENSKKIEIYNMLGEKIYASDVASTNTKINLSNDSKGVYLCRIITDTGESVCSSKFIIQ